MVSERDTRKRGKKEHLRYLYLYFRPDEHRLLRSCSEASPSVIGRRPQKRVRKEPRGSTGLWDINLAVPQKKKKVV